MVLRLNTDTKAAVGLKVVARIPNWHYNALTGALVVGQVFALDGQKNDGRLLELRHVLPLGDTKVKTCDVCRVVIAEPWFRHHAEQHKRLAEDKPARGAA